MRFFIFCLLAASAFAAEPIKIGVILPLTGNSAYLGERCQRALQMSYDDMPADKRGRYKLIVEDGQADLKLSLLAAKRFTELEHVDVILSFGAGPFKVIAPIAKEKDVIHVGLSITHDLADGKNNFSFWGLPADGAKLVVDRLKAENKRRVAVLNVITEPSVRQTKAFLDEAARQNLEIVAQESFNPGERDFRVILLKLQEKNPDVVFVYAWMPEVDIIMRQRKQMNMIIPFTSIEGFSLNQDRSLLEGMWYASALNPTKWFLDRYEKRFSLRGDLFESDLYDMLQFIYTACEKTPDHKTTRAEIAAGLLAIKDRPSATGILTVNEHGQIIVPSHLVKIVNGRLQVIE